MLLRALSHRLYRRQLRRFTANKLHQTLRDELVDRRSNDRAPGFEPRRSHVRLDVRPVHKRQVDGLRDVRSSEHHRVGPVLQSVHLREQRVDHPDGVRWLRPRRRRLPRGRQRLHLVNQHENQRALVVEQILNLLKQPRHELPALAEPAAEQAVSVNLDEDRGGICVLEPNRELLRQGLAQRRLARARRSVQQHHSIPRDEIRVHSPLGEEQRVPGVLGQSQLHVVPVHEGLPHAVEVPRRQHPLLVRGDVVLAVHLLPGAVLVELKHVDGQVEIFVVVDGVRVVPRQLLVVVHRHVVDVLENVDARGQHQKPTRRPQRHGTILLKPRQDLFPDVLDHRGARRAQTRVECNVPLGFFAGMPRLLRQRRHRRALGIHVRCSHLCKRL